MFPLLLLFWRRLNIIAAIALAFTIGLAPHFRPHHPLAQAIPWFLGLFALGMSGAEIVFSQKRTLISLRQRILWGNLAIVAFVGLVIEYFCRPSIDPNFSTAFISDLLVGIFALCVMIDCASSLLDGGERSSPRFITSRVKIGSQIGSLLLLFIFDSSTHAGLRGLIAKQSTSRYPCRPIIRVATVGTTTGTPSKL